MLKKDKIIEIDIMSSIFSAIEPSLGYLHQVRYGLLLIISEQNQDAKLIIEQIDDSKRLRDTIFPDF